MSRQSPRHRSGGIVELALGLVGGGSILAVPLLVYGRCRLAARRRWTSAIATSASALGNVKWRCATAFAAAGVLGASAGTGVTVTGRSIGRFAGPVGRASTRKTSFARSCA